MLFRSTDWKPITGENAWAFLIGPLQVAHLNYGKGAAIPFDDLALQNALDVLPTFAALQSAVGAVFYAPAGTIGKTLPSACTWKSRMTGPG